MGEAIRIWVDDRESRSSGIAGKLQKMETLSVVVKRLRTGDYLIEGKVVLERKRVRDFLESLKEGRLFAQASRLAAQPMRAFLILEGPAQEWRSAGVTREGIQGAMTMLSVAFGIPVLRSQSEEESLKLLLMTARQLQAQAKPPVRKPVRRMRGKRAWQIQILAGIPKVGPIRAQRMLDQFGTIEAIVTATPEDLAEVDGIGPRTAQHIHWAVHESQEAYRA